MTTSRDKAGGVADEELLRLARKAWPRHVEHSVEVDEDGWIVVHGLVPYDHGQDMLACIDPSDHCDTRQALHAALLVLASEVDLQAVLDARAAPAEGAGK